jgi:hypothetical protein
MHIRNISPEVPEHHFVCHQRLRVMNNLFDVSLLHYFLPLSTSHHCSEQEWMLDALTVFTLTAASHQGG